MSYQHMDHAGWLEQAHGLSLSEFQKRVVDILGMVGGGIYNAPAALRTIDWNYGHDGVSVIWKHGMATFDFGELTMLVLLCHEARIRCDVSPAGPRMLRLSFWQRGHDGSTTERHPNIEEVVAKFREYLPADHRIVYRVPKSEEVVA